MVVSNFFFKLQILPMFLGLIKYLMIFPEEMHFPAQTAEQISSRDSSFEAHCVELKCSQVTLEFSQELI